MAKRVQEELTQETKAVALARLREMLTKPKEKAGSGKMSFMREAEPEISALLEKGYTMKDIIDSLNDTGLAITSGTFHSYWSRIKAEKEATTVAEKPKRKSRKSAEPVAKEQQNGELPLASPVAPALASEEQEKKPSVAEEVAKVSPPGTGTVTPTNLKAGKERFGWDKKK